ncbi:hypothetical protein FLA_3892 [Filimonas lacunae]|nr:hypothetical protein FLA_3892 [Filimonas lacunae]
MMALLSGACTKDFTAINTDPNTSGTISSQYLLSTVLVRTAYQYQKDNFTGKPAEAARYITKIKNENDDLFSWSAVSWDGYYQYLSYNHELYNLAKSAGQKQYMAVSQVMRVFNFSYITDCYGDCPYSQALLSKDSSVAHPKYDKQEDIYPNLLNMLAATNDDLAAVTQELSSSYDVLYKGDLKKWRKFNNALRLRLLMRISSKDASAYTAMQTMLSNPDKYPLFESNDDNAEIPFLGKTAGDSWQGGNLNYTSTEIDKYRPSKELVDQLLALNDPRLPIWAAQVTSTTDYTVDPNVYVGVPNAISSPYGYNGGDAHISKLAGILYSNANSLLPASLMTYAEQCFILAEAMQKGKVTMRGETAASMYYKGIKASLSFYGISTQAQNDYVGQEAVSYNGTLEQVITQKWLSLFLKSSEGWFDNRRTGLPVLKPGPLAAITSIPSRYLYPLTEQSVNLDQYKAGVAQQGEDLITTKMWYLK